MLGVLITVLFALGFAGLARLIFKRVLSQQTVELKVGLCGLIGLGIAGWMTLPIGLLPNGLNWGFWIVTTIALAGLVSIVKPLKSHLSDVQSCAKGIQGTGWLFTGIIAIGFIFSLVGVLAPSTAADWDSIAYHLAVPKIWNQAGQIEYIPYIHHSNFPFCVDNLYIWGLKWGGQQGAKAFSLCFIAFGLLAIYGLAKELYGEKAAKWATVAFLTAPVVLWESGTAYIDLAQGLYVGLGVALLLSDFRKYLIIGSILVGFGIASKYTGLQSVAALGVVATIALWKLEKTGSTIKLAALSALIALAIGSPWLIKNQIMADNPVFPFFYERLGGKNWDQRRADIYTREQKSFGVGRVENKLDQTAISHAMLGLAYQPGRYVNPGPQEGNGFPTGAIGAVGLLAGLAWLISGKSRRFEGAVIGWVGLSLAMWFILSQQSRYLVFLLPPLCILAGAAVDKLKTGKIMAAAICLQVAYSLWLVNTDVVSDKVRVALGADTPQAYLESRLGFYKAAMRLNEIAKDGKVALYDEVFGFYLDVPYMWANPGHCTLIPYDEMKDGNDFAEEMKKLGFTHISLNFRTAFPSQEDQQRWLSAAGLSGQPVPYTTEEKEQIVNNWEIKYKFLIADACAKRRLSLEVDPRESGGAFILGINP